MKAVGLYFCMQFHVDVFICDKPFVKKLIEFVKNY